MGSMAVKKLVFVFILVIDMLIVFACDRCVHEGRWIYQYQLFAFTNLLETLLRRIVIGSMAKKISHVYGLFLWLICWRYFTVTDVCTKVGEFISCLRLLTFLGFTSQGCHEKDHDGECTIYHIPLIAQTTSGRVVCAFIWFLQLKLFADVYLS